MNKQALNKQAMAAQYTAVTLQDLTTYLKRTFRVLRPTTGSSQGEVTVDLFLNDEQTVGIRVWSSIRSGGTQGVGVGEDAIRVMLYDFTHNKPMLKGKVPIVKRTQGWRDNLKDRIEEIVEMFHDKEEYWLSRAG